MTKEQYLKLPGAFWDGEAMVYSEYLGQFYNSPDDAIEDLEEGQTIEYLMLRICDPVYAHQLEIDDWADDLGEDGIYDAPKWLCEAIFAFNQAIEGKPGLSWTPGKARLAMQKEDGE